MSLPEIGKFSLPIPPRTGNALIRAWSVRSLTAAHGVPEMSLIRAPRVLACRERNKMCPKPEDGRSKTVDRAGRELCFACVVFLVPILLRLPGEFGTDRLRGIRPVLTGRRRFPDGTREGV